MEWLTRLTFSELDTLQTEVKKSHFSFPRAQVIEDDPESWIRDLYHDQNPEVVDHLLQALAVALPRFVSFNKEMLCCLDNPSAEQYSCWRSQTPQQQRDLEQLFRQGHSLCEQHKALLTAELGDLGSPRLMSFYQNPTEWLLNRAKSGNASALVHFLQAISILPDCEEWFTELVLALPWVCEQLALLVNVSERLAARSRASLPAPIAGHVPSPVPSPVPGHVPGPVPGPSPGHSIGPKARPTASDSSDSDLEPIYVTNQSLHQTLTGMAARPVSPKPPASPRPKPFEELARAWSGSKLERNLKQWAEEDSQFSEVRLPEFESFTAGYFASLTTEQKLFLGQLIKDRSTKCPLELAALERLQLINEFIGKECSICAEPILGDQQSRATICAHVFHSDCLASWLERSTSCPVCRERQPKESESE